ncbi:cytochrome c [Acidovorax sp. Leaf78]|uniref:SorU family sulfite dehydrogenase c-type cytochrome subunit n=1 Tax=unclassified Acidovorax TaxID=2684926 RepID=UPI0009EAF269
MKKLPPEALRAFPPGGRRHRWTGAARSTAALALGRDLALALLLLSTGTSWAADAAELARGKELFTKIQPACAVCHTLQAAGAEGQVGPVLDELKPDAPRVLRALKAGIGVMPSYAERMSEKDMKAVASFVAHATGAAK